MSSTVIIFKEVLKKDIFLPRLRYLYGKHCPEYSKIPHWTNGILRSQNGIKSIPASYNRNNKYMKKLL